MKKFIKFITLRWWNSPIRKDKHGFKKLLNKIIKHENYCFDNQGISFGKYKAYACIAKVEEKRNQIITISFFYDYEIPDKFTVSYCKGPIKCDNDKDIIFKREQYELSEESEPIIKKNISAWILR